MPSIHAAIRRLMRCPTSPQCTAIANCLPPRRARSYALPFPGRACPATEPFKCRDGRPCQTHQRWGRLAYRARGPPHVVPKVSSLVIRQVFKPAASRGIVMGTRVDNCVWHVVVWQVGIGWITVKGELKNPRPCKVELVTQRGHIRRDQPQILHDER